MRRTPITEADVDIISQILAEEDVVSSLVLSRYSRLPLKDRARLVNGLVDGLDDWRKGEVKRRYRIIKDKLRLVA